MRTGELYQRYFGLYLGTVSDVNDPANLGRVRIECDQYVDSGDPDDTDQALWASIARPAAGDTSVFFTPKVGDQVVFGFLVGDVNDPIVIGYAHSLKQAQKPPSEVEPVKHAIVTDTFRIDLNEQVGERKLKLTNLVTGDSIELDAVLQTINIEATTAITIKAKGMIDIQAPLVQINQRPVIPSPRPI